MLLFMHYVSQKHDQFIQDEPDDDTMARVKVLYCRYLSDNSTLDYIKPMSGLKHCDFAAAFILSNCCCKLTAKFDV